LRSYRDGRNFKEEGYIPIESPQSAESSMVVSLPAVPPKEHQLMRKARTTRAEIGEDQSGKGLHLKGLQ